MALRRCVVTLGASELPPEGHPPIVRDFRPALHRLERSLERVGYAGDFACWENEYPAGSPSHRESPCGYKPYCLLDAASRGYDLVLWLDATVRPVRPVDELFEVIERDGYLIFSEDHSVGEYCKDAALAPLGLTREESFALPSCWACAVGLDVRRPAATEFLNRWRDLAADGVTFPGPRWSGVRGYPASASSDPRVKGHRYDQTAASVLALRLGMDRWQSKEYFGRFLRNHRRSVPTLAPKALEAARREEAGRKALRVLFFSRGRGRGHAVPDLAIAEELPRFCDASVEFVSYATGAETLREAGRPVIDLGFPEANPFLRTLEVAGELIRELAPDVVVAHEEFAVLPAARMAGIPGILVTDWLPPDPIRAEAAADAAATVLLAEPGFMEGPVARGPVVFAGPVVRKMRRGRSDRAEERRRLGLAPDAFVVAVVPGAWATEARAPVAQIVLPAFRRLPVARKRLFWLSRTDRALLAGLADGAPDVHPLEDCPEIESLLVASDVVLTKGNRGTTMDAASLGVRSISLSHGLNPVDDAWLGRVASNTALSAKDPAAAERLGACLLRLAGGLEPPPEPLNLHLRGGERAAEALGREIVRLARRPRS